MKKNLLIPGIAATFLMLSLPGMAETRDYTFDKGGMVLRHSTFKAETNDLAILLDNPFLKGKVIKAINISLDTQAQSISDIKVWVASALTAETVDGGESVFTPDLACQTVTIDSKGHGRAELAEPFTLTGQPVYVGYSFTVDDYDRNNERPLLYSHDRHAGGFWIHTSKSIKKWRDYEEELQGVLPIVVEIDGDFADPALCLGGWDTEYPLAQIDREFSLPVKVMNMGSSPVSEIEYSYSSGDWSGTGTLSLNEPIATDIVDPVVVNLTFRPITTLGSREISLNLTGVNGGTNAKDFSESTLPVEVRELVPVQRALLEEATGTWCSACPRGTMAIKALTQMYGDRFIGAAYHGNEDPMNIGCQMPFEVRFYPDAVLNRGENIDPYYGADHTQTVAFGIQPLVDNLLRTPATALVEVESAWTSADREQIDVTATVAFVEGYNDKDYRMAFLLLGNGLTSDDAHWGQHNSLAGADLSRLDDVLAPLAEKPKWIQGEPYDHVVLIANEAHGISGLIPSSLEANQYVEAPYHFNLSDAVGTRAGMEGKSLIQDKDRLEVVAMLLDPQGKVVNAAKAPVGANSSAVDSLEADCTLVRTEWYTLTGLRLETEPSGKGLYIRVNYFSDGNIQTAKTLK